jgi:thiosulfate dehydrogenase [quinone] large subunit
MAIEIGRRQVLTAGIAGVAVAGLAACSNSTGASTPTEEASASATPSATAASNVIATASDVPVGSVFKFTDPKSGMPAYLLQPAAGTFIAYSSKCTHQGCVVDAFPDANAFKCACHGAKYDLATGAPDETTSKNLTATPLAKIALTVEGDQISVA